MRRLILLFSIVTMFLTSCGVGTYTVTSGSADESAICFTAHDKYEISVNIDGVTYNTETVKQKDYKNKRKIKQTAKNRITITPGRHKVIVTMEGAEVYNHEIFISATEVKMIEL